jgi:uncharacterized protein (UPF0276 family)
MFPFLGHGIGLRTPHYADVLDALEGRDVPPMRDVDWFEIVSENFFEPGGNPRRVLRRIRERYPVVMHGVALSIGSIDPLDERYLGKLAALARELDPALVSDHLCWGGVDGRVAHDLLPLPFTEESLAHVVARVSQVQDRLGRRILLENVSSYARFPGSSMTEWDFLAEVARRADCGILLDVNNVFVSAHNHGFDARAYLAAMPADRIGQIHLAGPSESGPLLLDTHDHPVREETWTLYGELVARIGPRSTLVEWDDAIPPLARVVDESRRARRIAEAVTERARG